MKKHSLSVSLLPVILLLCMVMLTGCKNNDTAPLWNSAAYTEDKELGTGVNTTVVEVEVQDKKVLFTVHTDADTVGAALIENGLISGEQGAYGLYVKTVNGILADYDQDQSYWAFYIGDDLAASGVDLTEITEGAVYRLVYTK